MDSSWLALARVLSLLLSSTPTRDVDLNPNSVYTVSATLVRTKQLDREQLAGVFRGGARALPALRASGALCGPHGDIAGQAVPLQGQGTHLHPPFPSFWPVDNKRAE